MSASGTCGSPGYHQLSAPVHHQRPAQQEVVAVMLQKIAAHTIVIVMAMTNVITHLKRNQQITKKTKYYDT